MPTNDETKTGLQFVRDFYRGSSAYACLLYTSFLAPDAVNGFITIQF